MENSQLFDYLSAFNNAEKPEISGGKKVKKVKKPKVKKPKRKEGEKKRYILVTQSGEPVKTSKTSLHVYVSQCPSCAALKASNVFIRKEKKKNVKSGSVTVYIAHYPRVKGETPKKYSIDWKVQPIKISDNIKNDKAKYAKYIDYLYKIYKTKDPSKMMRTVKKIK